MRVKILRQENVEAESYWEIFEYDGPMDTSVAGVIDYINYNDDIKNIQGENSRRIIWDCGCLQGVCGACAMVINGIPALACETFLHEVKGKELELRPLKKFPVIKDLSVDRTVIHENLKKTDIYIGKYQPSDQEEQELEYLTAKCLKCGLCLEVCPNYVNGRSFYGALFANDCYLVKGRNQEKAKDVRAFYKNHFVKNCSKALTCMEVCPMNIPTITSMAKLNRWERRKK